jgi:hypothetical protein
VTDRNADGLICLLVFCWSLNPDGRAHREVKMLRRRNESRDVPAGTLFELPYSQQACQYMLKFMPSVVTC